MYLPQSWFHNQGKQWRQHLSQWLDRHEVTESAIIMSTALVVGIGAGLGAVIFRWLIEGMQALAYDGLGGLLKGIAPFHLLIIPAVGGAIFGPLIYRFAREAKGHGVPEVMEAVALRGGRWAHSTAGRFCQGVGVIDLHRGRGVGRTRGPHCSNWIGVGFDDWSSPTSLRRTDT